jgi:hypothetical protein
MYSAAWLEPTDTVTGECPGAGLTVDLQAWTGLRWESTGVAPVRTAGGALTYPGLGRTADPVASPVLRFRAVVSGPGYLPLYRATGDGVEFDAYSYNDTSEPPREAVRTGIPLAPAPAYRFPANVPVLRRDVVTAAGAGVADALVEAVVGNGGMGPPLTERTLTDRHGGFALPLRWARTDVDTTIVATFTRAGGAPLVGAIAIRLPGALATSHTIPIA